MKKTLVIFLILICSFAIFARDITATGTGRTLESARLTAVRYLIETLYGQDVKTVEISENDINQITTIIQSKGRLFGVQYISERVGLNYKVTAIIPSSYYDLYVARLKTTEKLIEDCFTKINYCNPYLRPIYTESIMELAAEYETYSAIVTILKEPVYINVNYTYTVLFNTFNTECYF